MSKTNTRIRATVLGVGFPTLVFAVFFARLFYIQIIRHDYYMNLASEQRIKQNELIAKRGEIYMMDGSDNVVPVVMNERTWTIFVDPSYVSDRDTVQKNLTEILGDKLITDWPSVWSDLKNMYVEVAKNVDYDTVSRVKKANMKGVGHKETWRRTYPAGTLAAQVLGFVNAEGVGSGVEGAQDERLTGKNGLLKTVTDVNDIPLSLGDDNIEIPAENGENIVLTLDETVQRKVEKVIKKTVDNSGGEIARGAALIMNPNNGRIYAMGSYPTFNPEEYWAVQDASTFNNMPLESVYEPASICKTFVFAAAINEGVLNPDWTYYNSGSTEVEDRIIKNASGLEVYNGTISFRTALDRSLNTGSVQALRFLGGGDINKQARTTYYKYLRDFGLGEKTGLGLYEEQGWINDPESAENGNNVTYANMSFGQGLGVTMVQMASGFSSIINGGNYYQPTVLAGTVTDGKFIPNANNEPLRQTVTSETSATMREMLREVRSFNGGYEDKPGYFVGMKTATAETLDENGFYTSAKTNVGTMGFGGSGKDGAMPQYVIIVRLDGNVYLYTSPAVRAFSELSNFMLEYLKIEPNNG